MNRRELLKELKMAARAKGQSLEFVREGGNHAIYRVGDFRFPIPRHGEIPERTARRIIKEVEES